jgi:hypothetical protein
MKTSARWMAKALHKRACTGKITVGCAALKKLGG